METMILRIYMPTSAKVQGNIGFWRKIFCSNLAGYLVKKAKSFGIEQAIFQRVNAGYLKGKKLAYNISEVIPDDFPVCIELVDTEERMRQFLKSEPGQFGECRILLFKTAQLLEDPN